jgi:hypothetical protein
LRGDVLPAEEPLHVDRRRDWFYLFAEGAKGAFVDALEETAFAPLDIVIVEVGAV